MKIGYIEFKEKKMNALDELDKLRIITNFISRTSPRITLEDCYKKPSEAKKAIYEHWQEWWINTSEVHNLSIRSYNTHIFTLEALYDDGNIRGIIVITPTKREIYN